MTNGFSKSKKADVSDKYNHVSGELKRARARIRALEAQLAANQQAWEGEEDSVREEHADLVTGNQALLARVPPEEVFIKKPAKE